MVTVFAVRRRVGPSRHVCRYLVGPNCLPRFWLDGRAALFRAVGYLLGGQVVHAGLDANFLKRFWLRRFFTHLPCGVGRAGHFVVPGLGDSGINLTPGYGNVAAPVSVVDRLAAFLAQPINGVWWTLPVELGFYLLLPLIGILVRHDVDGPLGGRGHDHCGMAGRVGSSRPIPTTI